MTDQIADARPPTRADHAERLRMEAVIHDDLGNEDDAAACLAGAAALEEVATLREERDRLKAALSNHLCPHDMADWVRCGGSHGTDLACDVCAQAEGGLHRHELVTQIEVLRARVAQLEQERDEALGIARGLQDVIAGRVKTLKQIDEEIGR
jgi:hypothetical protein